MNDRYFLIRNLEGVVFRENFLVSAVLSVIAIRVFLNLTGYPQLGGGDFHIAHMIWGGFLMMAAIILLLSFLNSASAHAASIIGGIGFGTFIDELGKFITKDNNYFFQPTIAIIYIVFVLIFLLTRLIPKYKDISKSEYLVNAIDLMKEAVINDLDPLEKSKAIKFLNLSDKSDPVVIALKKLMQDVDAIPAKPGLLTKFRTRAKELYINLVRSRIILNFIVTALVFQAGTTIYLTFQALSNRPEITFDEWGKIISSIISVLFVILGILIFRFSRLRAFNYFKIAVLTSIFLTQFFIFYQEQLSAVLNLILNIIVLIVIDFAIFEEQDKNQNGKIDISERDQ